MTKQMPPAKLRGVVWAIGLALLASGCSIFPEYFKPAVKTPENWQGPQPQLPHDGEVDKLVDWWNQFNDPALSRLLQAAEADSPTLDKALASIKSARANIIVASAQGLPTLTGTASGTRSKGGTSTGGVSTGVGTTGVGTTSVGTSTGSSSNIINIAQGRLDASWEIDLFGEIKFSKQAAEARLQARQSDWHTARVSLAAEVATYYVDYRACQLSVAAYQHTLDSKKETARLTNILADAGFSAPADAALAEATLRATESSLIGQQAQCDITVKSLVALTNLPEPTLRQVLASGNTLPQPAEFNVSSLPANLITQRPDLSADERSLAAASADIGVATANRYPSFSLTGSIGRRNINTGGVSTSSNTWSFGPTLTLPIFDGGKLKAQVSVAEANYATALATYQQDVRNAVKEVEQALVNLDSAARRETTEQVSMTQYRSYYNAAEINWRAGGISLITLEDARRQLINAELSHITQQHDRVQYWIALYKALGGGWQPGALPVELGNVEPGKVNPEDQAVSISGAKTKTEHASKSSESTK